MAVAAIDFEAEVTERLYAVSPPISPDDDRMLHPRLHPDRDHPIYGDVAMAQRKAIREASRARHRQIGQRLETRALQKDAVLEEAVQQIGSFVTFHCLDGRTMEGKFQHILDSRDNLPVNEQRRTPRSISRPIFVVESPDHVDSQNLRLMDIGSIAVIDAQDLPFRWQGDDS